MRAIAIIKKRGYESEGEYGGDVYEGLRVRKEKGDM